MKKYPSLLSTQGDKEEAIYSGLLKMGANMGGYSKTPISFMNRLSRAGQNFGTGYQDRIAQSKKDQLGDLEYQKMMGQMEAQQLALGQARQAKADADQKKASILKFQSNFVGPRTAEREALIAADPVGAFESRVTANAALASEQRKHNNLMNLELMKAKIKANSDQGIKPKDIISIERTASKEVQNELAPQLDRVRGYGQMEAIFADVADSPDAAVQSFPPTARINGEVFNMRGQGAADMALIFSFMKMQDPRSTVRESEFEMAASTGGLSKDIQNKVSKIIAGDRLSAQERKSLMFQARTQFDAANKEINSRIKSEKGRFKKYGYKGLDAERAFGSIFTPYEPRISASDLRPTTGGRGANPNNFGNSLPANDLPNDLVPR